MNHFPIFLATEGRAVAISGGGAAAMAKVRLLLKTKAAITVFASDPAPEIRSWAAAGRLQLVTRAFQAGDARAAMLFYAADENVAEDARTAALARADGALVNIVDNLRDSAFITPAIVDRSPVTVAIGTEGAAPVLARAIKSDIEAALPPQLGTLARIGQAFRRRAAALPVGRRRRNFWADFYFGKGAVALDGKGASAAGPALETLLGEHLGRAESAGHVDLVGAGPGDPELLTLKARKALDGADVVIHDRLVAPEILELARREATLLDVGKTGFGPATSQHDINALMVRHAQGGAHVVRLKSGDPTVFGRLDEEIEALDGAAISWRIVPGITAASAAVAGIGQSLTKRHRNSAIRLLTGHDTRSFAEHDWRTLAQPDEVAAIYMGKKSARFVQGRLLMHGAAPATPVTIVENATRPDQRIVATTLADLAADLDNARLTGPALMLYGLAPRAAQALSGTLLKKVVSR